MSYSYDVELCGIRGAILAVVVCGGWVGSGFSLSFFSLSLLLRCAYRSDPAWFLILSASLPLLLAPSTCVIWRFGLFGLACGAFVWRDESFECLAGWNAFPWRREAYLRSHIDLWVLAFLVERVFGLVDSRLGFRCCTRTARWVFFPCSTLGLDYYPTVCESL